MTKGEPASSVVGAGETARSTSFSDNETKRPQTARTISQEALAERKLLEQRFQHHERAKDNAQRRMFASGAGGLFVALLVASFLVAAFGPDADARGRAWDIVTLLVTGVVAAFGGYLSAKVGR